MLNLKVFANIQMDDDGCKQITINIESDDGDSVEIKPIFELVLAEVIAINSK